MLLKEGWSFTFDGGNLYVDEKSRLNKLALPLKLLIYEDIQRGEIVILSSADGERFAGEALFDAPELLIGETEIVSSLKEETPVAPLSAEEKDLWLFRELSPRRVVWEITLKPAADAWSDLTVKRETTLESASLVDGGGMMMMSVPAAHTNDLWMGIDKDNPPNVTVFVPVDFTNQVEIYSCTNLVSGGWNVSVQNLLPVHTNPAIWTSSLTTTSGFFRAGNMDIDSDGDGLPDARERIVHKTNLNQEDTDEDGYPDGWEIQYGLDPLLATVPMRDFDYDGFADIYEFVNGSDPSNPASLPSATRYVSLSGQHVFPFTSSMTAATNIQSALDAATNEYEIVQIADGVYSGAGNTNLTFSGRPFMLLSENGVSNCVIDGAGSGQLMRFENGETSQTIVRGIQFYRGFARYGYGGAIYCDESSPVIENCLFRSNEADYSGGAVCGDHSDLVLKNCIFEDNAASYDGAACYFMYSAPEMSACRITGS